jgi:hypothetical protein
MDERQSRGAAGTREPQRDQTYNLAKVGVEGSNPFARSRFLQRNQSVMKRAAKAAILVFALDTTQTPPQQKHQLTFLNSRPLRLRGRNAGAWKGRHPCLYPRTKEFLGCGTQIWSRRAPSAFKSNSGRQCQVAWKAARDCIRARRIGCPARWWRRPATRSGCPLLGSKGKKRSAQK